MYMHMYHTWYIHVHAVHRLNSFISGSGNLDHVEECKSPDPEINLWTAPDCAGTEFEYLNWTRFYFAVT